MNINIAVTGGIGSGKSTFLKFCQQLLPANYSSIDAIVADMYEKNDAWKHKLQFAYDTSDKRDISKLAFQDEEVRQNIVSMSMPFVEFELEQLMKKTGINVVEFPLLFEMDAQNKFDFVVLVTAGLVERIKRVMKRDGRSHSEVLAIMQKQKSEDIKALQSAIIVNTSGSDLLVNQTMLNATVEMFRMAAEISNRRMNNA